jgi:organic radical activating enzyme
VLTGGEPLLQVDGRPGGGAARPRLSNRLETNGTLPAPAGIDWVCVSPKADAAVVQTSGQELKLVYPQAGVDPARFEGLAFETFRLQPMDGPELAANTRPPSPIASNTRAGASASRPTSTWGIA